MNKINRYQILIIGLAVVFGLLLGQFRLFSYYAHYLIMPALMFMLIGIFLNIPIQDLIKSFSNRKFFVSSISINFIWTPIFVYILGYLFLSDNTSFWIGFVMLMVTPCTDWYLIFTDISKGNTTLSASILSINLILQIVLLPVYIYIFFGKSTAIDWNLLLKSIIIVLLIPFALAQLIRYFFENKFKKNKEKIRKIKIRIFSFFELAQVLFLAIAIMAMFASQSAYLLENIKVTVILFIPLSIFYIVTFFIGRGVSTLLKFNYEDSVSLNLTTLARNSPISLAIAMTAFPNEPLIALALVIAPLIELPVLGIISQVLLKIKNNKKD